MIAATVSYGLILLLAVAFYLFYPGYVSFFALALFLLLPLISLLFSLLQRRRYTVGAACSAAAAGRGQTVQALFTLQTPAMDPGEYARLQVRVEPLLYPQLAMTRELEVCPGQTVPLELALAHCGWYKVSVTHCQVPGWLGALALSLRAPEALMVLSLPQTGTLPYGVDQTAQTGMALRVKPGGGPGEEYELRPYQPGDAVNAIHWKLTAKQPSGDPILRETLEPVREHLAVTYDHWGQPEDLDNVLDQLETLARHLLDKETPFTVCHTDPETDVLLCYGVDCPKAWDACYHAISAQPAPPVGRSLPGGPLTLPGASGPVRRIHLTPSESREVSKS